MERGSATRFLLIPALVALCLAHRPLQGAEQRVTAERLQQKIDRLAARIRETQKADGALGDGRHAQWFVGQTALGVLALRAAGVPADDPVVQGAAEYLVSRDVRKDQGVYETSLRVMALASVDRRKYRPRISADARALILWQHASGGWGYPNPQRPDNSNSQFALLGLNAAAQSGVEVPDAVWQGARRYFRSGQRPDGGWAYLPHGGGRSGSMTAAGVASLYLCDLWLHVSSGRCGVYPENRSIRAGLDWLSQHFSVTRNPGRGRWKFYYLYALERAGSILAQRYFGNIDWYRRGVEHLVGDPERVVAAPARLEWRYLRDCYVLLFLAKGNAPILFHKARWTGNWNPHRYDMRFLTEYIGREVGQSVDWQAIPLDAPLEQLMAAPVLYVSGKGRPGFTRQQRERLRQYVEAGGLLLGEAARGNEGFDAGFRSLLRDAFPDQELEPLSRDHSVYSTYFDIPMEDRPRLLAVKGPCWVSVLYAPDGLSCPWDVADYGAPSFKLGVNIAAYAMGLKKLEGKLTEPEFTLPPEAAPERRRGAFTIGQVVHAGQWRPHKVAWPKVLERISREVGVDVYSRPVPVRLGEDSPFQTQMLYLTGVREVGFSEEQRRALRTYVRRGGFVFVEAACGSARFDESFRRVVALLFPEHPLEEMPRGHPLFEMGRPMEEVNYSQGALRSDPSLSRPALEHVQIEGRTVLVYSKFDLSSAIDGHPCYGCPAVLQPSAATLAQKIVLYGLAN